MEGYGEVSLVQKCLCMLLLTSNTMSYDPCYSVMAFSVILNDS